MVYADRLLESCYRPAGAGANFAYLTQSPEDDVFHKDADYTQWKQKFVKYTAHQAAVLVQNLSNAGCGKSMTAQLTKTPDLLSDSWTVSAWYGIRPNCECGVTKVSYVNARALHIVKCMRLKISTQTLFEIDGQAQLVLFELMGILDDYARIIGFSYTKDQLIEDSKFDHVLYAPWIGFPFQGRPDLSYAIGTIAFHPIVFEQYNRNICEMIVNYDGVRLRGRGSFSLPFEIATGAIVSSCTVDFALATTCVWVSQEERLCLLNGYGEIIFKEYIKIAEHTEQSNCSEKKVTFDVAVKGPMAFLWMTVQSRADCENGNWIKTFDDYGLDYIRDWMLITGSTPREDGLPASFYRTAKILSHFKVSIRRAIYVWSAETNATCKNFTGHQTMTNCEKVQLSMLVKAHRCTLDFVAYAAIYNGVYWERGSGGRMWG